MGEWVGSPCFQPLSPSSSERRRTDPYATPYTLLYIWAIPFAAPMVPPSVSAGMEGTHGDAARERTLFSGGLRTYLAPGLSASGPAADPRCLGVPIGNAPFFSPPCGRHVLGFEPRSSLTPPPPSYPEALFTRLSSFYPFPVPSTWDPFRADLSPTTMEGGAGAPYHL